MMTTIGKALVFVNLVVAVGLLTWAVSAFAGRLDYVQKAEGAAPGDEDPFADDTSNLDRLQRKVDKLTKAIQGAQAGYARSAQAVTDAELVRDFRADRYAALLRDARTGTIKSLVFLPRSALVDVTAAGQPILGVDNQPLKGLEAVQNEIVQALRDGDRFLALSEQRRNDFKTLSGEIEGLERRVVAQKEIAARLADEHDYLADRRTDWDEWVRTLARRKAQIQGLMTGLGGR